MSLKRLSIHHFRNITEANLELSPGINLVYGHNGSGKTSLLEAAYYLGMARSFRTPRLSPIVERPSGRYSSWGVGRSACFDGGEPK